MFTFQSIIFAVLVISGLIFAYFSTHPMTHSIEATTFLPSLPTIQTIRLDDQRFQSWHDSSSWDLLTPKNGGLVVEIDLTNGKSHRSQISMFHQLQCLRIIREVYLTISQSTSGRHEFRNNTGDDTQYHFLLDCWDYLRQVRLTVHRQSSSSINMLTSGYLVCCRFNAAAH
jgi:Mycotoxin biosynthesis protein UstYa